MLGVNTTISNQIAETNRPNDISKKKKHLRNIETNRIDFVAIAFDKLRIEDS